MLAVTACGGSDSISENINTKPGYLDDVESSLLLLNYLDAELNAHAATWFKRNILDLTTKTARELIRGRSGKGAQIDYDRLYAYHIFADLDATMKEPEATGI